MIRVPSLRSVRASASKPGIFVACCVLVAGMFSSACDSSTAPSLVVEQILVQLATLQLPSQGGQVTLAATITNGAGRPMTGVGVTFTATAGTLSSTAPVLTDASGQASVTLTTTGSATVKASAMGVESAASTVSVKSQATLTVTPTGQLNPGTTEYPNNVALPFQFSAKRGGSDVTGTLTVTWGDGSSATTSPITGTVTLNHTYEKGGTYSISANVVESDTSRATGSSSVEVREGLDQIDISKATMVSPMDDPSVITWPITSEITSIYVDGGQTCLDHTLLGKWRPQPFEDALVEGTHIIFANIGGKWYGGVYDYYRPGQTCKATNKWQYGEEQIRSGPMAHWVPAKGEIVGFMASTPARGGYNSTNERTYVKAFVFPY